MLRLHVIANSDTDADQAVKLKVRDAVLREAQRWYGSAEGFDEALAAVCTHLESLENAANDVLRAEGVPYRATAEVCAMYFPTRTYDAGSLPAGKYRTLRISLGAAEGKNWWCVVFPALCVPGASDIGDLPAGTEEVVTDAERFEVKFKAAELFQTVCLRFLTHSAICAIIAAYSAGGAPLPVCAKKRRGGTRCWSLYSAVPERERRTLLRAQLAAEKTAQAILIVPEQYTFETERALLETFGVETANRIRVYSFTRLAEAAFLRYGGQAGKRLTDGGRRILMTLAIEACADRLTLFEKSAASGRMTDVMLTAVGEMKLCGIAPDRLTEVSALAGDSGLCQKLREVALIYGAYESLVQQTYLDPLDDLTRLDALLAAHPDFFRGASVAVDALRRLHGAGVQDPDAHAAPCGQRACRALLR